MRLLILSSFCVLVFGLFNTVYACSCATLQGGNAPCAAANGSPLIFAGRVLSIEPVTEKREGISFEYQQRLVKFSLMKAYRGSSGQTVEVRTGRGGGDCGYNFEIGRNYLVYTYGDNGKLSTGICSMTKPLENASEDVEYFEATETGEELGTIFGYAHEYRPRRSTSTWEKPRSLANLTVVADGPAGKIKTQTNEEGKFTFANLKPGEYSVNITPPEGLQPDLADGKVKVVARACAIYSRSFSKKNLVSGRLLNELGESAGNLGVVLVPVEEINNKIQNDVRFIETDEDGAFNARMTAPGRYYLGFRIDRYSGRESGYPPTYYPGTTNIAEAAEIIISDDTVLENLVFQLRPKLKNRRVEGTILLPDGKPAPNPYVCAEEVGSGGTCAGTNLVVKNGKFSLELPDGIAYRLRVLIEADGAQKHAEPIDVALSGPVKGIKLVVSEPGGRCSKCIRN